MNAVERLMIGDWTADPATNELRRGPTVTHIEPKAMDVLVLLAHRAGRVVSREELFSCVWPGVVVGDEALTQSVAKLRRALGDNPQSPAYIETIAKRGYRLKASVLPDLSGPVPGGWRAWLRTGSRKWVVAAVLAAIDGGGLALAAWRGSAAQAPGEPSVEGRAESFVPVTVLPFDSLGGDRSQAYLARGIEDDLMTDLGQLSGLRMIAASGAAHAARYVISGSVQREGTILRINVRLVDTRSGEQLWSERYERSYGDLVAMQDDIVTRIARALPAKVSVAERRRLAARYTRSVEAYDLFLRAQALFLVRGARENREARALYRKALERDPRFARAYAGLAMTYAIDHRLSDAPAAPDDLDRARRFAESALLIDPDIAEVHWALGFVYAQRREHDRAIASLERTIALNPSFADAYALIAGIYTYMGAPAKSVPLLRKAMRLNPDGGYLYYLLLGRAYLFVGDIDQALINLKEATARNPGDLESHVYLAAASAAAGDRARADWEAQEIRSLDARFAAARWLEGYPLASPALRERLQALLAQAGLP